MARPKLKDSQRELVLRRLEKVGSITSVYAIDHFGATRLASIIHNLRNEGYDITSVPCYGVNKQSHPNRYVTYYLNNYAHG